MIYITGDIHGTPNRFTTSSFPEQKEMTKDDYVIICGDFGFVWHYSETREEKYWLDWLEEKPFTTLFIDGNHENFERLYSYPVEEWHGGKVHKIRPSVMHLMRGEVFDIDNKKIFAFGGASSHDISDGILDGDSPYLRQEIQKMRDEGKYMYRIEGISWWKQELPSDEEMKNGITNLKKVDNQVDYIITHSPSASIIAMLGKGLYDQDVLTRYLEDIKANTSYRKWFAGHMHVNRAINDKDILLYEQIVRIA